MLLAIDFFCGAGGLTRGLIDAGIKVIGGFDFNDDCRLTYEKNNRPARFFHKQIQDVEAKDIQSLIFKTSADNLLFAGCAPCQPFSKQRRKGTYTEQRTLLGHFGRLVKEIRPAYVAIENVPGISKVQGNSTYRRFLQMLELNKYTFVELYLDAKWFGVPQTRKRWVVIASRFGKPTIPNPTHGPAFKRPYVTVRDAIASFPPIQAGELHPTIPNHRASSLSDLNMKRIKATPPDGGGRLDWSPTLELTCHKGDYRGHSDVYGRMKWDAPAPTLTCRCYSLSNGRYGHPEQHRALSFREAATLQSFSDEYVFYSVSQKDLGSQIGNAVPVLLARSLGKAILDHHGARNKACAESGTEKSKNIASDQLLKHGV